MPDPFDLIVIGGMLAVSFLAIFLIPVTFYVVEKIANRRKEAGTGNKSHAQPETT